MTSHEQDLDMEELEARLYSQVYHSNEGDSVPSAVPQPPPAAYNRPRYFNASTQSLPFYNPSYVGSNESWNQGQNFSRPETSSNPPAPNPQMPNPSNCDQPVFYDHRFGYPVNNIFINFEPRRKRNKKKNEPKVKKLSSRQRRKLQSREDKKKNKLKALEQSRERVPKIAKDQRKVLEMLRQEGKTDLLIKRGFSDRNRDRKKFDRNEDFTADNLDLPADTFFPFKDTKPKFAPKAKAVKKEAPKTELKANNEVKSEVINLVESDNNSDCEINETAVPEVVVISEDEQETKREATATSTDDSADVVFVESPQKEAASGSAPRRPEPDRAELLGTPESTNDFLDNSFGSAQNPDEASFRVCVDEESDSASEFDPPKVFAEKEFEGTGTDSFSELNLASFTDYIASKASGKSVAQRSSESSSESDYEDDKTKIVERKAEKKAMYDSISEGECVVNEGAGGSKLPTLSPIDSEEDAVLTEKPARFSTPRPAQKASASGKAKTKDLQKRKSDGGAANVQAKKQKVHGLSDDIQTNLVDSELLEFVPSDDVPETELAPGNPDSCLDLTNVENMDNPAKKLEEHATIKLMRFSDYWTDDMYQFYYESWGQEHFSVDEEQRKMSDDPAMWKISGHDQIHIQLSRGPRCHRCKEFGHKYFNCRQYLPAPKCILCGLSGHVETRCPDKLCTSCGSPSQYFTTYCSRCARMRHVECSVCAMPGHLSGNCPDLWRRYYLTTREGPLSQPEDHALKPAHDRWCCGCGSSGHFESDCYYYNRTHPAVSPYIHSYDEVYPRRPRPVDVRNPAPGPSNQDTSPETDVQVGGKKSKAQRKKENRARKERLKCRDLTFFFHPNLESRSEPSAQQQTRFVRLDGVDVKRLLNLKGPDVFDNVVRCFPRCRIRLEEREGRYSYTLWGPSEHATTACYAVGAMVFKHMTFIGRRPDLTTYFSCSEDFTPETLRQHFDLLDSNEPWSKLAEQTRLKAYSHAAASAALEKSLPPEALQAIADRAKKLRMSLNCVILAKTNVLDSERSLKVLKDAAHGAEVDREELKRAYDHIFRNTDEINIHYKKIIPFLTFTGKVKRDCDQMLSHAQELCAKHNLTEPLQRLKSVYVKIAQKFSHGSFEKFTKAYKRAVEEARRREQAPKAQAKEEMLK